MQREKIILIHFWGGYLQNVKTPSLRRSSTYGALLLTLLTSPLDTLFALCVCLCDSMHFQSCFQTSLAGDDIVWGKISDNMACVAWEICWQQNDRVGGTIALDRYRSSKQYRAVKHGILQRETAWQLVITDSDDEEIYSINCLDSNRVILLP